MTLYDFNAFCQTLPHTEYVMQWGGAHVWKVGGKLFAMGTIKDEALQITFKVTEIGYEILRDMDGLRPAPYLASRGMKWIQHYSAPGLPDADLKSHIKSSYDMAIARMTKKARAELNL